MTTKNSAADQDALIKTIAQEVIARFNGAVDNSDAAQRMLETAITRFASNYSSSRAKVLTEPQRELLIAAITEFRANETAEERGTVDRGGSDSLDDLPDDDLLAEFFLVNPAYEVVPATNRYDGLTGAGNRMECVALLRMLAQPGMLAHIDSLPEKEQLQDWLLMVDDMVHMYVATVENSRTTLFSLKQEAQEVGGQVINIINAMHIEANSESDAPAL